MIARGNVVNEHLSDVSEEIVSYPTQGFAWPPKNSDSGEEDHVPTATPLYVPPPETQHVRAPPPPTEVPALPNRLDSTNACQSAPELRNIQDVQEIESGSESCTSTTNTTSEDYSHMRIYQPGPPGAIYDQGFSDSSEYVEHQQAQVQHKQSICSTEVTSINESAEYRQSASSYLAKSLDTQCLVDTIRALTPRPASPVPLVVTPRPPKHVEFVGLSGDKEEVTDARVDFEEKSSCELSCQTVNQDSCCMKSKISPMQIQNSVPHEWQSAMVTALQTAPKTEYGKASTNIVYEQAAQGTLMSSVLTTCPSAAMDFSPKFPDPNYPVPLPEETRAYFPPPINMKVIPDTNICGAKSPMLKALITAPERPYSPFPGEVIYQLDDLPTPTCKMDMQSALTTASERPYTPLLFDHNGLAAPEPIGSSFEQQSMTSAFASVLKNTPKPFMPVTTTCDANGEQDGFFSTSSAQQHQQQSGEQSQYSCTSSTTEVTQHQQSQHQHQEESIQGQWQKNNYHSERGIQFISQPLSHNSHAHPTDSSSHPIANTSRFGNLHKPDTIPSYQQNFQNLASQQPHRPPVSPQLKKNVSLAFIESPLPPISFDVPDHFPSNNSHHHHTTLLQQLQPPQHKLLSRKPEFESDPNALISQQRQELHGQTPTTTTLKTCSKKEYGHQDYTNFKQISVPLLPKPNGPITMTFQSLDDMDCVNPQQEQQQPFYHQPGVGFEYQQQLTQQHQKQVRDEMHQMYAAPRPYTPSMINKPAPIIPHYQMNLSVEECKPTNSEIFDPSRRSPSPLPMHKYAGQGPPPNPLKMQAQGNQPQVLESSHFREFEQKDKKNWMGMQGASETTFLQRPEEVHQTRVGNLNVLTKSNELQMNQNKRMEAQSQSEQQVGNSQVKRCTRVVEEFERSQTAKIIEIKTNSDGNLTSMVNTGEVTPKINENEMPPPGIVANQARRFSQDVATSSSVASKVQSLNESGTPSFFPTGPVPVEKSRFPVYNPNDTKRNETMVFPPPGFSANCGGNLMLAQQQQKCVQEMKEQRFSQLKTQQINQSSSYSAKPFSYTATSDLNAITIPSITQFKPMNNNSNSHQSNKGFCGSSQYNQTNPSNLPPSPLVFPPSMNHQQVQKSQPNGAFPLPSLTEPLSFSANSTSSSTAAAAKASSLSSTSSSKQTCIKVAAGASVLSAGYAICSPSTTNNSNKKNNNNNKGGAGITVGPKRGRGIMNKAVAPGGRTPLCGCCNSQIRQGLWHGLIVFEIHGYLKQ